MSDSSSVALPLTALSTRQQRLVESHRPLVYFTLDREKDLVRRHRAAGQFAELVQEGHLALIDAIRSHDTARHGAFAPYAMARIHYAVSRFVHETHSVIRVPFITQRRRRRRFKNKKDRHDPHAPPRVVSLTHRSRVAAPPAAADGPCLDAPRPDALTVGDQIRARYERAARHVAGRLADSSRVTPGGRAVAQQCAQDRWFIPDPDEKTSIRELARSLNCPISQVMRCEERFRRRVGAMLECDDVLRMLWSLSRRSPDGLRHRFPAHEAAPIETGEPA